MATALLFETTHSELLHGTSSSAAVPQAGAKIGLLTW